MKHKIRRITILVCAVLANTIGCICNADNDLTYTSNVESQSPPSSHGNNSLDQVTTRIDAIDRSRKNKKWTIMIYMAADNDLAQFARHNLVQIADIGSDDYVNFIVQLDTRIAPNKKITKRYYIQKGKLVVIQAPALPMDSGDPETLIDFCGWGIENYPATHYGLVLWNHGSGIIDLNRPRAINPFHLFKLNENDELLELNRTIPFLDYMNEQIMKEDRGICFDDTTGHYLTNQGLEYALKKICENHLKGGKLDIIGCDACLMAMIEFAALLKPYAHYLVASQEVELGAGWPYHHAFSPLTHKSLDPRALSKHIVEAYAQTYHPITKDYTQSSIDLSYVERIEQNIDAVSQLLLFGLDHQKNGTIKHALRASRHRLNCTHFDEPSYIDMVHWYTNLLGYVGQMRLSDEWKEQPFKNALINLLSSGIEEINNLLVVAQRNGPNLPGAHGISIYFPEHRVHNSYPRTGFAKNTHWVQFLERYINL